MDPHDLKFLFAFLLSAGLTLEQLNVARSIDFMAYLTARARRVGGRHASTPAIVSDRLAPATINRVMAAVSTFYEHLLLTRALSFERNPLDGGGNEQRSTRRTNRRSMRLRRVPCVSLVQWITSRFHVFLEQRRGSEIEPCSCFSCRAAYELENC